MSLRFQQKLIIPATARPLVERPRLLTELEQVVTTRRVVALAAPAGWGKTTTLAQWAAGSSLPVAWYTLDPADRDPQLFLDYLLHSVAAFVPAAAEIVTRLSTTAPQGLPELIHATALAISAAPAPFALVLDDFHVLDEEPRSALPGAVLVFDLLASVAQYAGNCHLVLASRTLPTLHGLVRMVAQQRAAVFDYAALQFSVAEIQQLAGMAYALTLSDESAGQLVDQLGGWVTGIVLSLDNARTEGRGLRAEERGSDHSVLSPQSSVLIQADTTQVYAYFVEQVILPLDPELLRFLEDTSVLEDLSPRRCEALRKTGDAALLLDEVKRHGLFVSSRAGWLAYHSLFRDFLRTRLARDPHRQQSLLLRAGDLYRDEEDVERALDCYLAAGAEDQAIDLLRAVIPGFRQRSRQTTLLACFERLQNRTEGRGLRTEGLLTQSSVLSPQPSLLPPDLLLAQARVYSDLALWEQAYLALQLVETLGDQATRWEARMLCADFLNLQGDYARARAALDDLPTTKLPPRLQLEYHVIAGRAQILSGEVTAAIKSLEKARTLAPADDAGVLADIHDNLGWAYATQGDRSAALRHLKRADACWQASGNSGRRALTLNNLGTLAMEEGRFDEARAAIEAGLEIARATARRREETLLRCSMAEVDILEGELDQAIGRFTEAHTLSMRMDVPSSVEAAAAGALWAAALAGDLAVAQAWLDIAAAIMSPGQPEVRGRLALGQCLLALHQPRPSLADLADLADLAAEATAAEAYLSAPERAYVALLRATLTFERSGWPRAAAEWETFTSRAAELSDALLLRFVPPHQRVFEAAAASSPLARRLVDILKQPAPSRWQITMLGSFACLIDGAPCDLSPLHRALLARLLDAGPQGLTVERLWESVWGDTEVSMAALHQALRRLRVQTGLAVAARDGHCAIRSNWDAIEYDVGAFEQALEPPINREAVQRVVALYRGDFLPSAPLSAALWVDTRRAHLQQRYLDALEQLAHAAERDAPQMAIHYYQQVLQVDGCREQTAAQLMRLAARFGNRSLVNATFEHLKGALRTLGAQPEPSTAALYQQLH
jgi:ATP/maltotriose-dependent transcriptional regulator MalT/DNA-binding SARP family transcriptional activator